MFRFSIFSSAQENRKWCELTEAKFNKIMNVSWISTGLREFWEEANVLKIAVKACCKQYCLRRTKDDELYCVGNLKNKSPKIICSLEFSLVTLFVSRQRK